MSNEENPDVIWSMENNSKGETVLTVYGVPIGSPQELAALVRDARRFRKLMQAHWDMGGEQGWSDWYDDTYNRQIMPGTLAEIADALPEAEQK